MRLVKTADEIRSIQSVSGRGHSIGVNSLRVTFATTPEAVSQLLPPPLEATPEAVGVAIAREVSNSTTVGPFTMVALFLRARHENNVGLHCVAMLASTPEAVTFQREVLGYPCKHAKITFDRQDEHVWGSAERHEVRFLSLRGRLTEAGKAGRRTDAYFGYKFSPRADGSGFEYPPRLVEVNEDANVKEEQFGRGELVFRETAHDPIADIPIAQVVGATFTESDLYTTARPVAEVDPEAFLPYAFAGIDAIDVLQEDTLLHAQGARRTRDGRGRWRQSTTPA